MATARLDLSALSQDEKAELRYRLEQRQQYQAASAEERKRIQECSRLQADFSAFAREAWPTLEPGVQLDWSWHYDLIAEYLTMVYEGSIRRLIVNISPRTAKSLLVCVIFPAWVWTKRPTHNFACASYSAGLSTEHSVKRRTLIESPWYQSRWGDKVQLARDQNEKTKFKNTFQAQMIATSVGGTATGLGGNTLILDDGMNPKQVGSEADTKTAHDWFDNTWRTRLNNLAEDSLIVIEQRTGERDITGHCLEADAQLEREGRQREWTHLAIPLEQEDVAADIRFPISGRIVHREPGDVLQPKRFPPSVVNALKQRRLVYATQYQQHPSPLEGNMIKRSDIRYYGGLNPDTGEADEALPIKFDLILTSADCSFKDLSTSDYVAVGTFGVKGSRRYVLEVVNKHLDETATETEILRQRTFWGSTVVLVEDKANGPAVIKKLKRNIQGIIAIEPEGGKISRMFAACGEWQSNDWYVSRTAAWTEPFIEQITVFPSGKHDDMADMMTQTAIYLQKQSYQYGFTEYLKQQDAEMKKQSEKITKAPTPPQVATADEAVKMDRTEVAKPEIDDKTLRCPDDSCRSTLIQRVAGGHRCGQCGLQFGQPQLNRPTMTNFGTFRK